MEGSSCMENCTCTSAMKHRPLNSETVLETAPASAPIGNRREELMNNFLKTQFHVTFNQSQLSGLKKITRDCFSACLSQFKQLFRSGECRCQCKRRRGEHTAGS